MDMRRVKANYNRYCREYDSNEAIKIQKEILLDKIQKLGECIDYALNEEHSTLSSEEYKKLSMLYSELDEFRKQTFEEFCDSWVDYNREE